jgi:validoxylamine A glucosyltransferase
MKTARIKPKISIIVTTYNRSGLLWQVLDSLRRQSLPADEFEVIVSDDGSSDDTRNVVESFEGGWTLKYHYQEDLGFRAAEARNAGARLATAPILAFLDSGTLAGPDFAHAHLMSHAGSGRTRRAVIGPVHGYGIRDSEYYPAMVNGRTAANIMAEYASDNQFLDVRYATLAEVDFEPMRLALPWLHLWSGNFSIGADTFWSIDGFDEDFRDWGVEDLDLAFRLWRSGAVFVLGRDAWAIELPHERDEKTSEVGLVRNIVRFLEKNGFGPPSAEILAVLLHRDTFFELENHYRALLHWQDKAFNLDIEAELRNFIESIPHGSKVAIFGSGTSCATMPEHAWLLDFDQQYCEHMDYSSKHTVHNGIGILTPHADNSFDYVLITARMTGIWGELGDLILAEASRIAHEVRLGWHEIPPFIDAASADRE